MSTLVSMMTMIAAIVAALRMMKIVIVAVAAMTAVKAAVTMKIATVKLLLAIKTPTLLTMSNRIRNAKKDKIIISVLVAVMVVIGGFYLYASRTVAKRLPGHVYEYTSVSGNQNAYMTFATSGDQVVVTPDKRYSN